MSSSFYEDGWLPYAILAFCTVLAMVHTLAALDRPDNRSAVGGLILTVGLVLLIGSRPISGLFVDMTTYASIFERAKSGALQFSFGDPLFDLFTRISASLVSVEIYFLFCAGLYVIPKALACRIFFRSRWPLALALMATSFSFYAYGVNGIRNGIAASLGLLAIAWPSMRGKLFIGILAVTTHASLLLTMAAHAIALRHRSVATWIGFWLLSIPISIFAPSSLMMTLASIQGDERASYFDSAGRMGAGSFRWDFIAYGAVGVVAIAYWKWVRKTVDPEYDRLASTYLIANAFWILINEVAFSNRFAYLSWFLMEVVIVYPLLRQLGGIRAPVWIIGLIGLNIVLFELVFG